MLTISFSSERPWAYLRGGFVSGWTAMILSRFHARKRAQVTTV
jgi:hypothetical protein